MPMRILLVSRAHSRHTGGMERLSVELAAALKKNPTLTVELIAHHGSRAAAPLFVLTSLPRVLARARQVHVVHFGDPLLSFSAWCVKKFLKKPVCITVHGLDITYPAAWYQRYLRMFLPIFDRYIAISTHVQTLLTLRGISGHKTTVISPAATDTLFDPAITRDQLQRVLTVPADAVVLLTVGRLVARKGHAWFITNVLPRFSQKVVYVIAGSGPERSRIVRAAAAHNVAARVHLLDRVTDADVKVLYNTADAFVQPNIQQPNDPEGFGLVLLEAALCQLPVFAADVDGIPSAIHHGRNGTLLPPGNTSAWQHALQQFIKQPHRVPQARDYTLRTFQWQKTARQYISIFTFLAR